MKSATVVNVDMGDVASVDSAASMHTKQLADHWKVSSRALTEWIAEVRSLGYEIGQKGERNRTYFNDVDMDLIKAARYKTLTPNPRSRSSENSENVLGMQDHKVREAQEAATEAQQNRNLELQIQLTQSNGSQMIAACQEASYQEGAAIAIAEFNAKFQGYAETKVAVNAAFAQLIQGNKATVVEIPQHSIPDAPDPKQLIAALF